MSTSIETHVTFKDDVITIQYHPDDPPILSFMEKRPRLSAEFKDAEEVTLSPMKGDFTVSLDQFFSTSHKQQIDTEKMRLWEIRQALRREGLKTQGTIEVLRKRLEKHLKKPKKNEVTPKKRKKSQKKRIYEKK
ncbi:hypothetical protein ENUP19_0188G0018 [Entamoeba nuttalli]|uniref:SAP domain-containing protein n=2 Tax=Entamoeba nuttalli TaxID=412467 RepID=K2H1Z3_ENTNP|nr:hypothetical protein ENU1_095530 [Entamoeba nuttalli P19]EKE40292.1 hypothetical protein ENU1_095530 [Entamoeba nuttalli P19]|eukprot:XP_008857372.1 hypothetical protein ENU1_095530 [Entamoeba nuttalli P19]